MIRDHHERWDGGGFPSGARGLAIPYLARVLAVADSFSSITIRRPDLSAEEAYRRLEQEAARRLDPELTRIFFRVLHRKQDRDEYIEAKIPYRGRQTFKTRIIRVVLPADVTCRAG